MFNLTLMSGSVLCGEFAPHCLQWLFTSLPALISVPINLVAWRKISQIRAITQAEIDRNSASNGRKDEELKEQIALNLYIGNFDQAEMCSKKLLALAEQN